MRTIFGMGRLMGGMPFDGENMREKWSTMNAEEKKEFVEKQIEFMNQHFSKDKRHKFPMSVEDIDKRCEDWQKMSGEEKEEFVKSHNKMFEHFHKHHHRFGMCHNF